MQQVKMISVPSVTNNGQDFSVFSSRQVDLSGNDERMLSEQMPAINFRVRESGASYVSDWHVAGDATLLIVLAGTLRLELRSGETQDFTVGKMFVVEDFLSEGVVFDNGLHGHRAEVVGDQALSAIHVKLAKRTA
jgi:hypothetical protein